MGSKSVLSQDQLNMLVFKINSHVTAGQGSALERFFGRNVGTYQMVSFIWAILKLSSDWCSNYFLFSYWISKVYSLEMFKAGQAQILELFI